MTANHACPPAASGSVDGLMPGKKLAFILQHRNKSSSSDAACALPRVGFVGIGKTGSLFMQTALELFAHEQLLSTSSRVHACTVGARMGWHHASAQLWKRAHGSAWTEAFTFALVRNPWARLVSHWAFHLTSHTPLDGGFLSSEQRVAAKTNESRSIGHFRAWVRHFRRTHPPTAPAAWRFTTGDAHGNEHAAGFNASQLSWLVDAHGALLVDAVYKLEELELRWAELQARVCGLRGHSYRATYDHPLVRAMDHSSRHAPFAAYYDEETSRIVGEYMAPDVRRFGYASPVLAR